MVKLNRNTALPFRRSCFFNEMPATKIRTREVDLPSRYRFNLENGHEVILDETGVVADDLDLATEEALEVVEEMRASGELTDSTENWTLVICDEGGNELKRIPL